ncbi:hypothetical protein AB9P05_14735 [Roseivirga sp. BDSF3-8]|uniref:hypothetical protein n=1 Tax=Roseivirga sp. BDSF3-8 TaxID=3241598 RepID=UPI0035325336
MKRFIAITAFALFIISGQQALAQGKGYGRPDWVREMQKNKVAAKSDRKGHKKYKTQNRKEERQEWEEYEEEIRKEREDLKKERERLQKEREKLRKEREEYEKEREERAEKDEGPSRRERGSKRGETNGVDNTEKKPRERRTRTERSRATEENGGYLTEVLKGIPEAFSMPMQKEG